MNKTNIKIEINIMLFIIFLILKLDSIIDWKWIWIFSPFWIVWIFQICTGLITTVASAIIKWKWDCSLVRPAVSGPRLVWDAKTNTLFGPWTAEDNETE